MSRGFVDVTGHTWARNILNGLYAKGIMKNARTGEFGANDTTSRGEFATLLVKGLNLPLNYDEDNVTFFDTAGASTTTWDYRYIETAARAGIVTGLEEGFFGPSLPITRQDAAVMIARALKLKMSANDSKLEASLAKSFVDSGTIQYYARPAVEAVNKAKIMTGSAGSQAGEKKPLYSFNPKANMTRAEAGKIAVELLKKSTDIFPKTLS
nr:S-layer homology domain-containing protein [Cohnella lubricantis]